MIDYLQFKVYEHAVKYHRKLIKCVSVCKNNEKCIYGVNLWFISYISPDMFCWFCRCKFCCISFSWRPSRRQTVRDRVSCFPRRSKGVLIPIVSVKQVGKRASEYVHPLGNTDTGMHKSYSFWAKAGVLRLSRIFSLPPLGGTAALLNIEELYLLGAHLEYYWTLHINRLFFSEHQCPFSTFAPHSVTQIAEHALVSCMWVCNGHSYQLVTVNSVSSGFMFVLILSVPTGHWCSFCAATIQYPAPNPFMW